MGQPISSSILRASSSARPSASRTERLMASTDSGPFWQISSATRSASSRAVPSGTTRPISPIFRASWALTGRAVSSRSMAMVKEIWRGRRTVEPPSGNRPRLASKMPKVAPSPATLMSVAWRSSEPPATA